MGILSIIFHYSNLIFYTNVIELLLILLGKTLKQKKHSQFVFFFVTYICIKNIIYTILIIIVNQDFMTEVLKFF